MNDVKLIKTALLKIYTTPEHDIVKISGIVNKLINWYKQFKDPEYKKQVIALMGNSSELTHKLTELNKSISNLKKSISEADVSNYEKYLSEVKILSGELLKLISELKSNAEKVEENNIVVTPKDNREDYNNVSFSAVSHLKPATKSSFYLTDNSKINQIKHLKNKFSSFLSDEEMKKMFDNEDEIFDAIYDAILDGTIIDSENLALKANYNRPLGQKILSVKTAPIHIKSVGLTFTAVIVLVDKLAQQNPQNQLSIIRIRKINNIKKTALDKNNIIKLSWGNHAAAREILTKAFISVMGREPTLPELQLAQAVAWNESNYGQGWGKGSPAKSMHEKMNVKPDPRAQTSNNWGAVQTRTSRPPDCPGNAFRYVDSSPLASGASRPYVICFKTYPTPQAGAEDLIKNIFKSSYKDRGEGTLNAAQNKSIIDFSSAMYDGGYYQGFGKTREARIAGHAKSIERTIKNISKKLNETSQFKTLPKNKTQLIEQINNSNINTDESFKDIIKVLFANNTSYWSTLNTAGNLDLIVKNALKEKDKKDLKIFIELNDKDLLDKLCFCVTSAFGVKCDVSDNKIEFDLNEKMLESLTMLYDKFSNMCNCDKDAISFKEILVIE